MYNLYEIINGVAPYKAINIYLYILNNIKRKIERNGIFLDGYYFVLQINFDQIISLLGKLLVFCYILNKSLKKLIL